MNSRNPKRFLNIVAAILPLVGVVAVSAAFAQRFPADSRPQDVAMAKHMTSDRNMIPMMRDMLAGTARQMAAADQPFDIEQMFEQVQMDAPRGRSSKPKEVVPVDPTIKTLDCKTLNARLREVDKTIDKKIDEVEAKQTALDSKIDAGNAANAAVQSAGAQACNRSPLGCLASAVTNRIAAPALDAQAMSNAAAINEQRDSREAFNPLLRERTTIVYYAARKSCN
jgi:hypothetical protein